MGRNKCIDQHFLDHDSKTTYYIRGASYFIYRPPYPEVTRFASRHKKLVKLVYAAASADYEISSDKRGRNFHWITFGKTPYLYEKMGEWGLNNPKEDREFPQDIPRGFMRDLVRGILDAGSWMQIKRGNQTYLRLDYNHDFVAELNKVLVENAGVEREEPKGNSVSYGHNNSIKIGKWIYGNSNRWEQVKKEGLYLPSKKKMFKMKTEIVKNAAVISRRKVEAAKPLLLSNWSVAGAARKVGLSAGALSMAFKRRTGKSPRNWLNSQASS